MRILNIRDKITFTLALGAELQGLHLAKGKLNLNKIEYPCLVEIDDINGTFRVLDKEAEAKIDTDSVIGSSANNIIAEAEAEINAHSKADKIVAGIILSLVCACVIAVVISIMI